MECFALTRWQHICMLTHILLAAIVSNMYLWVAHHESEGYGGSKHKFKHPILMNIPHQLGGLLCFSLYYGLYFYYKRKNDGTVDTHVLLKGNKDFSVLYIAIPSVPSFIGNISYKIAGILTPVGVHQTTAGINTVFVAIFSVMYLKANITDREWTGIFVSTVCLTIVEVDVLYRSDKEILEQTLIGLCTVVVSQIFTAIAFVFQEKLLVEFDMQPLMFAGWSALYSLGLSLPLYVGGAFITPPQELSARDNGTLIDIVDATTHLTHSYPLVIVLVALIPLSGCYQFLMFTNVKSLTVTTTMILLQLHLLLVWAFIELTQLETLTLVELSGLLLLLAADIYSNFIVTRGVRWLARKLIARWCAKKEEVT